MFEAEVLAVLSREYFLLIKGGPVAGTKKTFNKKNCTVVQRAEAATGAEAPPAAAATGATVEGENRENDAASLQAASMMTGPMTHDDMMTTQKFMIRSWPKNDLMMTPV